MSTMWLRASLYRNRACIERMKRANRRVLRPNGIDVVSTRTNQKVQNVLIETRS